MKSPLKLSLAACLALASAVGSQAQSVGTACGCPAVSARPQVLLSTLVNANDDQIASSQTLTCNNLYILDTRYYVLDGQDLFIEPGTVIKAQDNAGIAHAIIVTRGGQIWANGSEECPIIMTSTADPLDGNYAVTNRGVWGSIILLGRAYTNKRTADGDATATATNGVGSIEGLATGDSRHFYGMPVGQEINNDNSGVLRYVSLRHGGEIIGANNEINGLTLGGVGNGTIIENIEVIANKDDGFEMFGGTVNAKYLVAMHNDDDYIDWDQGYNGKLQFIFGLQGPDNSGGANNQGDNGFEADGDDAATNLANGGVASSPTVYNATIIARNINDEAIEAKERTNGTIVNSIFARSQQGLNMTTAVEALWNAGTFNVKNCTFQGTTNPLRINGVAPVSGSPAHTKFFTTDGNLAVAAESLIDATYAMTQPNNVVTDRVNPVPAAGTATTTIAAPLDGFFSGAKYRGAFEPGKKQSWLANWTLADVLGTDVSAAAGCVGDLDNDGDIDSIDFGLFSNAFGGNCF